MALQWEMLRVQVMVPMPIQRPHRERQPRHGHRHRHRLLATLLSLSLPLSLLRLRVAHGARADGRLRVYCTRALTVGACGRLARLAMGIMCSPWLLTLLVGTTNLIVFSQAQGLRDFQRGKFRGPGPQCQCQTRSGRRSGSPPQCPRRRQWKTCQQPVLLALLLLLLLGQQQQQRQQHW